VVAAAERAVRLARCSDGTFQDVESLGAGWVAEEALAIALYCALQARDYAHGVRMAVNHSGDSDSTGSMAGNLLGLLHGEEGIPARWLACLELREEIGEVAHDLWWHFAADPPAPCGERPGCGQQEKYPGP
jgi:ADP-ribosylglycohydrolase